MSATGVATFSVVYQLNYLTALLFQWRAGVPGSVPFDPQEPLIVAVAVSAALALLWHVAPAELQQVPHHQADADVTRGADDVGVEASWHCWTPAR